MVGCVIEGLVLGHVLVHILGLDLKEEAASVRVEELAALSVLRFELVVIEVVHQVLGEIQNAHAHIHRAIEYQIALVDLDSCQIIVEDICTSKCWAGDAAPEFVLLIRPASHQPASAGFPWSSRRQNCSSTCIGPSQSRWQPSSGVLYSFGCMAPSNGFGRTGGLDGLW